MLTPASGSPLFTNAALLTPASGSPLFTNDALLTPASGSPLFTNDALLTPASGSPLFTNDALLAAASGSPLFTNEVNTFGVSLNFRRIRAPACVDSQYCVCIICVDPYLLLRLTTHDAPTPGTSHAWNGSLFLNIALPLQALPILGMEVSSSA